MTDKTELAKELKNLLPQEKFKPGFHAIYENLLTVFAEDIIKTLQKDHSIEMIENEFFIVKKKPELEGFEKFLADSTHTIFDEQTNLSFPEYLEDFINSTGRNQFFK